MRYEKGNFITVPNKSELKKLDAHSQVLFMWLCSFTNEQGQCYPSVSRLAECCGLSKNTIIDRVKILIAKGFLTKTERYTDNAQQSNLYQIHLIPSSGNEPPTSKKTVEVVQPVSTPTPPIAHRTKTKEVNIKEEKMSLEERQANLKKLSQFADQLFKRKQM